MHGPKKINSFCFLHRKEMVVNMSTIKLFFCVFVCVSVPERSCKYFKDNKEEDENLIIFPRKSQCSTKLYIMNYYAKRCFNNSF